MNLRHTGSQLTPTGIDSKKSIVHCLTLQPLILQIYDPLIEL